MRAGGASGLEQVPGEGCPPPAALLQGGRARLPRWSSVSEPAQPPPCLPAPPALPCVGFSAWGQGGRSDEVSAGMSWMQLVGVESGVWASCPASPAPSPRPAAQPGSVGTCPRQRPMGTRNHSGCPCAGATSKTDGENRPKISRTGRREAGSLVFLGVRQQPHRPPCPNPVTPAGPRGEGSVQRCVTGHYSPSVPPN